MKTKEKYDSLVFRLKCHLLRWGQCERGRRRKEDQDLTLGHIGFEILRCPNGRVKKAGPGTTLDIMDELRDLGEGEETMQLNLRKAALCLGVGGWGGEGLGGEGECMYLQRLWYTGILLSTWSLEPLTNLVQ